MEYKKNQKYTVEIVDISQEGLGVGKLTDGYTVFVKDAIPGDECQIILTKVKKNYGFGRLEDIIRPSDFRVEPRCAFHKSCGGCQIQAMNYKEQLKLKENKVKNDLIRIGGFDQRFIDGITSPILGMDQPFFYRNKALFPIGKDKSGRIIAGFYAGRTHSIIANTDCALGVDENKQILEIIIDFLESHNISVYDETSGNGLVRHVLIRKGFNSGEIMVCIVINGKSLPHSGKLVDLLNRVPGMKSISLSVNTRNTNAVMGEEIKLLSGTPTIKDSIGGIWFDISPLSFFQVNPKQTEVLYGKALEYAGLSGNENVWDLYCGIGTISLFLAQKAKKVYGVEIVEAAINDARANAKYNGMDNAEFFVGKAEEVITQFYESKDSDMVHPDVIVVDPPRKGCDEICIQTMQKMEPEKIVYVSCDPATLARDLQLLTKSGVYELKRVQPVDMFPQTVHVETVVLLSGKKSTDM